MEGNKKLQRAEFIKMSGGLAFLMLSSKWLFAENIQAANLVNTAQKRQEYTTSLLKKTGDRYWSEA